MDKPKKTFELKPVPGKPDRFKFELLIPLEDAELKVIDGGKPDREEKDDG